MRIPLALCAVGFLLIGCSSSAGATPQVIYVTPAPTTAPTPDAVPADTGNTGVITFGAKYDPETLLVTAPKASFKRTAKAIAWSASFSRPAGSTSVTLVLAKVSKGGGESIVVTTPVDIASPDFDLLANSADLAAIADNKAGTYVLRYIESGDVLAEGTFKLT